LPDAIARQITQTDQQIADLQHELRVGRLVRENLVLKAALELSLDTKQLAWMELAREGDYLVFRPIKLPVEQS
jgi:hypothetical protein